MATPLNELTTGDIMEGVGTPNVDDLSDDGPLIMPPNSVEAVSSVPIKYGKRKRRSSVWEGFKVIPGDTYDDGKERAECLKCKIVYRADTCINGTGTLRRHLKNCPKQDNKDVKQMMLGNQGKMELRERNIDLNLVRDKITRLIVKRELPLKFVEHEEFRDLLSYICPEYCHISRNTQMAQITRLYHSESKKIKDFFKSYNGKISLTSDMWTSITNDGYISLTAHFVDKDWSLHKKLLRFSLMQPPHSGIAICDVVSKMLHEWGIEKKLFSITLDNAASNLCFVEILKSKLNLKNVLVCDGDFFHNRCCAHILNLIVQDGLKCIDDCVSLIRNSITYVKSSQSRKIKFMDCCKELGISTVKGLHPDVCTRWNSTYHMLESAFFYRKAFENLQIKDNNYKNCPNSFQWSRIEKLISFLQPFDEITILLSGSKYPTENLYFFQCVEDSQKFIGRVISGEQLYE